MVPIALVSKPPETNDQLGVGSSALVVSQRPPPAAPRRRRQPPEVHEPSSASAVTRPDMTVSEPGYHSVNGNFAFWLGPKSCHTFGVLEIFGEIVPRIFDGGVFTPLL